MTSPPRNARAALQGGPAFKPTMQEISHGRFPLASGIPRQWLREGARLVCEAERSQQTRYWRAAAIHLAGILARTGEKQ